MHGDTRAEGEARETVAGAVVRGLWRVKPSKRHSPVRPGTATPIGGLKVVTRNGWFAARPSGTENIYKIYAESFLGEEHLERIENEARGLVAEVIS